jgi:hypothetical protein
MRRPAAVADLFLKRTLSGFAPADEEAEAAVRGYKVGQIYRAKVTKPRSYAHHKLIMALLTLTYRNLPEQYESLWPSFDSFRKGIALDAGHCEEVITSTGEIFRIPGSLSYDALDELAFTKVSAAMMTVCARILDMSEPELAGEVSKYADQSYGVAA